MTRQELERTIRNARGEAGPCAVYSDWLQTNNDPAGEWIAIASALESKPEPERQQRLAELSQKLGLPAPDLATWGTRNGMFEWLRLENQRDWMDSGFDALALANPLFALPMCAALDELRIGVLRWEQNATDVPAVLAAAANHPWAASLSRLRLGDVEANIDMAHHVVGDIGAAVTQAFPSLRSLFVHSGSQEWAGDGETFGIGGLALPQLESLVIETCAMTQARLASLFAAKLPKLDTLSLWFGGQDYDSNVVAADLAPLLEGRVFQTVTKLGIKNQGFSADLIPRLGESPLGSRLEQLDLSMSTLDAATAPQLAAIAPRFPKLKVLDVSDNFLTADDLAQLKAAFGQADVVSTSQDKLTYAEGDDRFVTVHE